MDLVNAGRENFKPTTYNAVVSFKSEFWADTNISAELTLINLLVGAYNKVERHLEEIYLLREDSERFKKHLIDDAASLERYLETISLSLDFSIKLDETLVMALKAQLHRRLSEYYNLYNTHSLPTPSFDVPSKDPNIYNSVAAAIEGYKQELALSAAFSGIKIEETKVEESAVSTIAGKAVSPSITSEHAPSVLSVPTSIEAEPLTEKADSVRSAMTSVNSLPIDGLSERAPIDIPDDPTMYPERDNFDLWSEQLLSETKWLSTCTMFDSFRLMFRMSQDSSLLPPRYQISNVLGRSGQKSKLINYVYQSNHWICVMCTKSPNTVTIYNSLHRGVRTNFSQDMKRRLTAFFDGEDFTVFEDMSVQQQPDECNCGVFAIMFGQCLFRQENPSDYRFKLKECREHLLWGLIHDYLDVFPRIKL